FWFGFPLANHLIDVTLAGADGPKGGDLGAMPWRHGSHGNRILVNIHADEEWARLGHGWPPSLQMMVRHQAALVSGKLTRVTSGVNLPSLEVIMSRLPETGILN